MISMRELSQVVFPHANGGKRFCMIVQSFLDDSADQRQEKVVIYAGFMGTATYWDELGVSWKKILRKHRIQYFHSTECRSLTGEFARFYSSANYPKPAGREAANKIKAVLKGIIERVGVTGVAVGVLVPDYAEVLAMPEAQGKLNPDPSELAFQSVMFECAKAVRKIGANNKVTFVCDNSTRADRLSAIYREYREKNPKTAKMIGGLTHLDDKECPPLQAADLMAHLAHDLLLDKINSGNNPQLQELRGSVRLVAYLDKKYILSVLEAQTKPTVPPPIS